MPQTRTISVVHFDPVSHTYRYQGTVVPHVTQILAAAGKCDWSFVDEDIRVHSMARGRSVHWMTQLEDERALDYRKMPIGLRGYRKAWQSWKRNSGFEPVWIERVFYSRLGFSGRLDRAGNLPTGLGVVDIKTGTIPPHTRLQLAAYTLALDSRIGLMRNVRRIAVQLMPDGRYKVQEYPRATYDSDLAEFMECLRGMQED